ncbi:hypothetical protein [Silvibacterium acidisoli]|uniref:hypothetical protein n=1 Tax=Acidobacteriaceae bacterium ZG23-2 TaxID=2883246 RepID=UPI00406C7FBF
MKKERRFPPREARRLFDSDHLTNETLLRLLDGELTDRETDEADYHIQACWSCRSRRQAIEQGISDLYAYQEAVASPYLPPPLEHRSVFLARVDALANELGRPSPFRVWLNALYRALGPGEIGQVAWIAGLLLLLFSIPAAYFLHAPAKVSAEEILSRAQNSENASLLKTAEPVVVQKLRISVGSKTLTRTMYRDVKHHRTVSHTDSNPTGESLVRAAYSKYSLDWNSPLDVVSYRRWRASRQVHNDRVVQTERDRLTLQTTYARGNIAEMDLTVRTSDYHAVREDLRLRDNSEIEIAELSYEVVPLASVASNIFELSKLVGAVSPPPIVIPRSTHLDSATLAIAEVSAEVALHNLGADLGEQIKVSQHDDREILVEGVVDNDARKQELVSTMETIPHTRLHILTIDEAARQSASVSEPDAGNPAHSSTQQMISTPPLLDAQLNTRFPDKDQRIAYVNQALSLAQLASARAWALNRLADRHPSQEVLILNEEKRQQLQTLLSDHISALREDVRALQNQLGEILSQSSNTPAANTSVKAQLEAGTVRAPDSSGDWRDRIHRIHSSTEAIHEAVVALLSSSQPHDENDADGIEINLRTSLTQLDTELQDIDQKVHEPSLK